ncbi:MAG: hypothetical protein IJ486_01115 [Firmicutes bacterium]|nr:hypothetical protein [Bacillota bacterium]
MKRQWLLFVLALLLSVSLGTAPVFAESPDTSDREIIRLQLSERNTGSEGHQILGTVELPEEFQGSQFRAEVYASGDGLEFQNCTLWSCWDQMSDKTTRCCMIEAAEIYQGYRNGITDELFVYLEIIFENGMIITTETASLQRGSEATTSGAISYIEAGIPRTLLVFDRTQRPAFRAEYHMTAVSPGAIALRDLLPETLPVQLDIYSEGEVIPVGLECVKYSVVWNSTPEYLEDGSVRYQAVSLTPPDEDLEVIDGEKRYVIEASRYPQDMIQNSIYSTWYGIVHMVTPGEKSELLLSSDDRETGAVVATMPLKPTGAVSVLVQVSTDGGTTWNTTGEFDKEAINAVPSQRSCTAEILTADRASQLLEQGNGGFLVRMQIIGGALGNAEPMGRLTYSYSEAAAWPADYDYVPPKNPEDSVGNGGNTGNVGTNNEGTGGIRPGINSSGKVSSHKIDVLETLYGKISTNFFRAKKGRIISVTAVPEAGYVVGGLSVRDSFGKTIPVVVGNDGTYSFEMPGSEVTVESRFVWDNPFRNPSEALTYYTKKAVERLKEVIFGQPRP